MPLSVGQRKVLEKLSRLHTARHRDMQCARALLLSADGVTDTVIGVRLGVSPTTVSNQRKRFMDDGLKGIGVVRKGRSPKPLIPPQKVTKIVQAIMHEKSEGETDWSCRSMPMAQGVSSATVQRVWFARNVKFYRVKTFKHWREILGRWYRDQLWRATPDLIERWERKMSVTVPKWTIRRMKTKWGSCNRETGHIWLNIELAKKHPECLEYLTVHEMTHLLERSHGPRFTKLMDKHLPDWRARWDRLNEAPLGHEQWVRL